MKIYFNKFVFENGDILRIGKGLSNCVGQYSKNDCYSKLVQSHSANSACLYNIYIHINICILYLQKVNACKVGIHLWIVDESYLLCTVITSSIQQKQKTLTEI